MKIVEKYTDSVQLFMNTDIGDAVEIGGQQYVATLVKDFSGCCACEFCQMDENICEPDFCKNDIIFLKINIKQQQ